MKNDTLPYEWNNSIENDQYASGWLDAGGRYWPVPNEGHSDFANWWIATFDNPISKDPVDYLRERGWVHISDGSIFFDKNPNQNQINAIYDWLKKRGKAYFGDKSAVLALNEFVETYA